jgi:hypothetical protein
VGRPPTTVNGISPTLPPIRRPTASRTEDHIARPSRIASMIVSTRSSVTTSSAASRAAGVERSQRARHQGCGSRGERVEGPWGDGLAQSSVRVGSEQSRGTDRKVHRRYGKPQGRTDNRRLKGQAEGYSEPPRSSVPLWAHVRCPVRTSHRTRDPWFVAMVLSCFHPPGRRCSIDLCPYIVMMPLRIRTYPAPAIRPVRAWGPIRSRTHGTASTNQFHGVR